MSALDDGLVSAVAAASAAASDSMQWDEVLKILAHRFHATAVALHTVGDDISGRGLVSGFGLPPDTWSNYAGGWHAHDPWVAALGRRPIASGSIFIGRELCDWPEFERTDYYNGFCIRHGIRANMALVMDDVDPLTRRPSAFMSLYRRPGLEEFGQDDRRTLKSLHAPLRLALHAHRALAQARRFDQVAADMLDAVPKPLIVLAADGKVLHANPPAAALLARNGWIGTRHGRVTRLGQMTAGEVAASLRHVAAGMLQTHAIWQVAATPQPEVIPAVVRLVPLAQDTTCVMAWPKAAALLLLDEPDADQDQRWLSALARRYDLTPAETRLLARLAQGARPADIAQEGGVSIYTVRAHLRHLFDKTGVRRQSELVRLAGAAGRSI